jgi:hypothetical protein
METEWLNQHLNQVRVTVEREQSRLEVNEHRLFNLISEGQSIFLTKAAYVPEQKERPRPSLP